jgi:hypothetical protein
MTVAKQASNKPKRQTSSMQTRTVYFCTGQNAGLQARFWKQERIRSVRGLSLVLFCRFLKIVCDMVWDVRLLNTSILVTKVTLRAQASTHQRARRTHMSLALINDVKSRVFRVVKEMADNLFHGLKQFVCAFFRGLE